MHLRRPLFRILFRIQQVDNGFFERFASLLREHTEAEVVQEQKQKEAVEEEAARVVPDKSDEANEEPKTTTDSSDGEASSSSDTESEEPDKSDFVGVGFNVSF